MEAHHVAKHRGELYVPSVRIKSSQAFSSFTFLDHVTPDLSCAVAEVAVVMMEDGRRGDDSTGGCNILRDQCWIL